LTNNARKTHRSVLDQGLVSDRNLGPTVLGIWGQRIVVLADRTGHSDIYIKAAFGCNQNTQ
ncbi:MAG: hypothetical protein ACUVXJ_06560, partial [Phycisphaerae bacterium]